jgi:hypothetical protein
MTNEIICSTQFEKNFDGFINSYYLKIACNVQSKLIVL